MNGSPVIDLGFVPNDRSALHTKAGLDPFPTSTVPICWPGSSRSRGLDLIDLFSRKVVGLSLREDMTRDIVRPATVLPF